MKKICAVICSLAVLAAAVPVGASQAPAFMNFQSLLYDEGGNPLPDGVTGVSFRITDAYGRVYYEEHQAVDVARGAVSAIVGNGLDANGAPTGGIPSDALDPRDGRYLDVTIGGAAPQTAMEIVSVPYALFANEALAAAPASIDGKAIAAGSITAEHLATDALGDIGEALAGGGAVVGTAVLREADGAASIGVRQGFTYSGSTSIQGVLQDFDRAIDRREERIDVVEARIAQEVADRRAADERKVSKDGDNIGGDVTVCGDVTVDCGGNLIVNQTDIYQMSLRNLNYFGGLKVLGWGTLNAEGQLIDGWNLSVGAVVLGVGSYQMIFDAAPGNANYVVMVTCQEGGSSPCMGSSSNKTTASFLVRMASVGGGFSSHAFDVLVLGRQ